MALDTFREAFQKEVRQKKLRCKIEHAMAQIMEDRNKYKKFQLEGETAQWALEYNQPDVSFTDIDAALEKYWKLNFNQLECLKHQSVMDKEGILLRLSGLTQVERQEVSELIDIILTPCVIVEDKPNVTFGSQTQLDEPFLQTSVQTNLQTNSHLQTHTENERGLFETQKILHSLEPFFETFPDFDQMPMNVTFGDATLTSGDATLTSGNANLTSGNANLTSGDANLKPETKTEKEIVYSFKGEKHACKPFLTVDWMYLLCKKEYSVFYSIVSLIKLQTKFSRQQQKCIVIPPQVMILLHHNGTQVYLQKELGDRLSRFVGSFLKPTFTDKGMIGLNDIANSIRKVIKDHFLLQ